MSFRFSSRLFTVAAAALIGSAGSALAQPFPLNGLWSYQGRLTDAGVPANGTYDIQIAVYDRPVGGGAISISFHNNVNVTNGLFTIPDVSTGFLGTFQGDRRWAEIQVRPGASGGAFTVLAPRQELTATPYAMWANRASVAGTVNNHTLDAAYDSGGAGNGRVINADSGSVAVLGGGGLDVESAVRIGDADTLGVLQVFTGTTSRTFEIRDHSADGGAVEGYDEGGVNRNYFIEPDVNGEGGFLNIYRGGFATGFTVDGNAIGGDPTVSILGSSRSMTFSPGAGSDNGSVLLPVDSIASSEILDEPGVASAHRTGPGYSAGVITITEQASITAPVDGFLLVIASAEVVFNHANGTADGFTQGINVDNSASFPGDQDFRTGLPTVLPSGTYTFNVTSNGIFPVSAGVHTVYYLGQENSGDVSFTNDVQLSVVFFPTAYGAVDPRGRGDGPSGDDEASPIRYSITPDEVAEGQYQAEQLNAARLAREVADLKAQIAELRRLVTHADNKATGDEKR